MSFNATRYVHSQHVHEDLPACDCDMYMPPGQHDPIRHRPGYYGVPLTKGMIEESRRVEEEAKLQAELAERARVSEREAWIKASSRTAQVTVQAGNERRVLKETPTASTLCELSNALQQESRAGIFTCGGHVSIDRASDSTVAAFKATPAESEANDHQVITSPIVVRWGPDGHGRSLTLPTRDATVDAVLQQLISDCIPATFGRNGEDVYDESYRRAGALGTDQFTTDFCPYKLGIMDSIAQLLLPPITGDLRADTNTQGSNNSVARGLRAELYKLNVYSGPSGMFRPHVDTPRGTTQIGSLVVCLPTNFQGGALAVRHQGHEIKHDWASTSSTQEPAVHWAAFYSDCEHEVLEVTSGHRITLTYNLFLSDGTGLLNGRAPSMKPELLPLTHQFQRFLARPDALPAGGFLGIHLVHAYPHTHPQSHAFIPRMLKGADMAVYEALTACGLHGVLAPLSNKHNLPLIDIFKALTVQDHNKGEIQSHFKPLAPKEGYEWDDEEGYDSPQTDWECEDCAPWWPHERTSSGNSDIEDSDYEDEEPQKWTMEEWNRQIEIESHDIGEKGVEHRNAKRFNRQIVWLNPTGNREISRVYLVYGNQAELAVKYSSVALVVKVPSWEERRAKGMAHGE